MPKKSNSHFPTRASLIEATFKAITGCGGSATNDEIQEHVIEILELPDHIINMMHADNTQTRLHYELRWARTYDCFYTPPELPAQKQEIEECHQALSGMLGKPERRLVLQIIDANDRIAEDTSIDSFIAGFELAWKLSMELNHYEDERSVSCRTAMELRARFTSKEEEK